MNYSAFTFKSLAFRCSRLLLLSAATMDYILRIFKPFIGLIECCERNKLRNDLNMIVRKTWLPVPDALVVADPRLAVSSKTGTPASAELDKAINEFLGPGFMTHGQVVTTEIFVTFSATATFDMVRTLAGAGILSNEEGPRFGKKATLITPWPKTRKIYS